MNQQAPQGSQPAKVTKSSHESVKLKNSKAIKLKARSQPLAPQQLDEAYNNVRKAEKKDRRNCGGERSYN